MSSYKGDFSITFASCLLFTSAYLGIASFIYLLKTFKSEKRNENVIVFLCSLLSIPSSVLYFLLALHYEQHETLLSNSSLCKIFINTFKTTVIINKCLCNGIFACRYRTLNKTIIWLKFSKIVLVFSAAIIIISIFQLVFDHSYASFTNISIQKNCFYFNMNLKIHFIYIIVIMSCFFFTTILQTSVLIKTIRPIYNHLNNNSSVSTNRVRKVLKTLIVSSLLFAISDIVLVVSQFVMLEYIGRPMPLLAVTNINLNCISLMFSYGDHRPRLFPFFKSRCTQSELNVNVGANVERKVPVDTNRSNHVTNLELQPVNDVQQNVLKDISHILN